MAKQKAGSSKRASSLWAKWQLFSSDEAPCDLEISSWQARHGLGFAVCETKQASPFTKLAPERRLKLTDGESSHSQATKFSKHRMKAKQRVSYNTDSREKNETRSPRTWKPST